MHFIICFNNTWVCYEIFSEILRSLLRWTCKCFIICFRNALLREFYRQFQCLYRNGLTCFMIYLNYFFVKVGNFYEACKYHFVLYNNGLNSRSSSKGICTTYIFCFNFLFCATLLVLLYSFPRFITIIIVIIFTF